MPNDIVDLISLEANSQVTLTLEEKSDRHLLVYSVLKNNHFGAAPEPGGHPINAAIQRLGTETEQLGDQ